MRSVADQLAEVTAAAMSPRPVRVGIFDALGLLCAEEVVAERALPSFDQAAIDGYAVRSVDLVPPQPAAVRHDPAADDGGDGDPQEPGADREDRTDEEPADDLDGEGGASEDGRANRPLAGGAEQRALSVVGQTMAGSAAAGGMSALQCVRVDTGAPLPTIADAVLPLNWATERQGDRGLEIDVRRRVLSGQFVRRVGDDVQPGDVAVRQGAVIGSAQVGLLASVGRSRVLVHPKPRVAIISIGDELVDIDRETAPGQVYDVTSYALAAAAQDAGADVHRVGIVSTEPSRFREVLAEQLMRSEIVVISGAVGGEATSRARQVIREFGNLDLYRAAMHPGSVQGFGRLGRDEVPTFLLPTNAASALVVFEVMVRPLVRISLGKRQSARRTVLARTIAPITSVEGRHGYLRGQLMRDDETGQYLVRAFGGADGASTHLLAALAEANCLVSIPEETVHVRAGEEVEVMFLAQRG
ncbi:gephyrin-like molybdotransferase Glp [Dietzia timorensis]|uniref:Molybdopterin molybdenumtransferase n=1 Tax=Dietzia timorensis TaxID=499555 RepID=A0A173LP59_9ACTN|nr:gephyrin-like molybdotransferase Glp [Dietzia timorensis]ANI93027.1 Molybdopterin molybdenumtransferase 1 [Dietzia timorensis]